MLNAMLIAVFAIAGGSDVFKPSLGAEDAHAPTRMLDALILPVAHRSNGLSIKAVKPRKTAPLDNGQSRQQAAPPTAERFGGSSMPAR